LGCQYNIPGILKRAFYELLRTAGFGQIAMGNMEYEVEGKEDGDDEEHDGEGENSADEEDPEGDSVENEGDSDEKEGDIDDEEGMSNAGDDTGEITPMEPTDDGEDDCAIPLDDIQRLINAQEHLTTAWILTAASVPTYFPCLNKKACRCMSTSLWTEVVHTSGMFED
jgi:hypothetical protein